MFTKHKVPPVVFVKDNTLGDIFLYLRSGDFDGGYKLHYLFSLVEKKVKAIPDDLYQLTYSVERSLRLANVDEIDPKAYYVSLKTQQLFQAFNRVMTNNYPVQWSIVGTFVSISRETKTILEHEFLSEFKEIIWDSTR